MIKYKLKLPKSRVLGFSSITRFKSYIADQLKASSFDICMHRCQLFRPNQGIYLNECGRSCLIETSPLICSASQWTAFCIIGTSIMKDSRRSLSTNTESLFLHVVKHNLFFLFLSICLLLHEYLQFTGQQVKGEAISLYPFYHFLLLHRHSDTIWVVAAERSPLRIAGSRNGTWDLWYTLFRIHSFFTCTGSCCC